MKTTRLKIIAAVGWICILSLTCGALPARAGGKVQNGEDVFAQECAECHSVREGKNKKGPSLFAVLNRKAASIKDFSYSDSLAQSGLVWSEAALDAYIANPRKSVPGGKMKYDGLSDASGRADLIAYLASLK
ncbi:c-type cytochrome [Azoarcus sp. L1K30]|uniref:c-type cytochrome n=1 Tax=Azoarcus sp. L1K30 TaxID=2820277 RepID=UPI001B84267D|nr:c-type cytochrome [Azoarcus sp. L1K30]MBR0568237.1 c-type cytochrome [Azoarcus sp. L1K30]